MTFVSSLLWHNSFKNRISFVGFFVCGRMGRVGL